MSFNISAKHRGFTLIELMIAVAIIGILAAIAYPSYQEHVKKSHRAEIKGQMMNLAQALERHRSKTFSYTQAFGGDSSDSAKAPKEFRTKHYDLSYRVKNNTFKITAKPTSSLMQGDRTFVLDHQGNTCSAFGKECDPKNDTSWDD